MQSLTLPINVIILAYSPDAANLVQAQRGTNGLKKNKQYRMVAVNNKGQVAVMDPGTEQLVTGPSGKWHAMDTFEWITPGTNAVVIETRVSDGSLITPANDNAK